MVRAAVRAWRPLAWVARRQHSTTLAAVLRADLPGFTRSTYQRDHALITPESRVWTGHPGWWG